MESIMQEVVAGDVCLFDGIHTQMEPAAK